MSERPVEVGDVVQIDPEHDAAFGGCLLIVTEVKSWGVQGCVPVPQRPTRGDAYYRVAYEKIQRVGVAPWVPDSLDATPESPEPQP